MPDTDLPTAWNTTPGEEVKGFMCRIDWECELGVASRNTVYSSLGSLKADHSCWEECGVVEVAVRIRRVVHPGTDNE